MDLINPISFSEAVTHLLSKGLMPTALDSAGLRAIDAAIRRQSIFSAENLMTSVLDRIKGTVESVVNPKQEPRTDPDTGDLKQVTVGYNPATARVAIRQALADEGYAPDEGIRGTIKDLSSSQRINLVVDTNVKLAQGAGHFIQANASPDVVDLWPAWEFIRAVDKIEPRQWDGPNGLWVNACRRAGDATALRVYGETDRMCALKSSRVWGEISNSEYTSGGLDQPFDPVAFGTGMVREEMSRDEAEEIGLLGAGEKARPAALDLASLFQAA